MSGFSFVSVGRATTVTFASFLLLAAIAAPETGAAPMDTSPLQTSTPIKLFYDEQLVREGFPSPALRVTVGEITAWLLVDTGASVHTLASWFVRDAGIPSSASTITASDSAGHEVTMRVARDIPLKIDGAPWLMIPEAAIADFPPDFQRLRIAGLLSPQLLAGAGTVSVLDLRAPSLQVTSDPGAMDRVEAQNAKSITVCRVAASPLRNLLFGLGASVAGVNVALTLDTGASSTILDMSRPAAKGLRDLQPDGFQTGASGVREPILRSAPMGVDFGAGERTMPLRTGVPQHGCGADGLIGMDAVRNCVLAMSDRALALRCDPPPGAARELHDSTRPGN